MCYNRQLSAKRLWKQRILILVSENTFAELVNYHWVPLTGKARYIMGSLVAGSIFDLAKEC